MRHTLIIAGGSGTRLWPMSRNAQPKQLIPFIQGRSLLEIAADRLEPLAPAERRYVCAGAVHREAVLRGLPTLGEATFLGEPMGRDTLNAVGLAAAVIARRDPQAVIGVFTADHVIEPVDAFRRIVARGFEVAEQQPESLVTFGIRPTHAATGYGYLELGEPLAFGAGDVGEHPLAPPRKVARFKEKPDSATAQAYLDAGPGRYLWNSGMFVWRAATLLDCIARYEPANHEGLSAIAEAWDSPRREAVLARVYPTLKKISVDFAVMERASADPTVKVVAVPMDLSWLDVGSWPSFAAVCPHDEHGNALAAQRILTLDASGCLIASSDPAHAIALIGCENLLVVHTPDATLVCHADRAEDIKKLHAMVPTQLGPTLL